MTLFLEWGQDLVLLPSGGLQSASGWDETRQLIERFLFTNADVREPSGIRVLPDYVFHPNYGLGLRVYIGELMIPSAIEQMRQKCLQACLSLPSVSRTPAPQVIFDQEQPHLLNIFINVQLADNTPGQIALELSR